MDASLLLADSCSGFWTPMQLLVKYVNDLRLVLCPVRYEYDGNDVYELIAEEEDHGRVVALLIWVRDLLTHEHVLFQLTQYILQNRKKYPALEKELTELMWHVG